MKKKSAFTIVEMLAVIVVLGITLVIVLPNIVGISDREKQRKYDQLLEKIYLATESYLVTEYDNVSYPTKVKLDDLIAEGYLEGQLINPITNLELDHDLYILAKKNSSNKIVYEYPGNIDDSNASEPNLANNMIPVYYDSISGAWEKADTTNTNPDYQWYDYSEKMWANAVTVTSGTRSTYQAAAPGTEVSVCDVLTFHVWIPRYRYILSAGSGPRPFSIIFEDKSTTKSTGDAVSTYLTHPGFTFNNNELDGIWFGKFDAGYYGATSKVEAEQNVTTANKIIMKPNRETEAHYVYAWRYIQLANAFTVSRGMEDTGNMYGFTASAVDTHLTKNIEWGAVTYLTSSIYGKNEELFINANSSFKSGCSSGGTASVSSSICYEYSDAIGQEASTTGNIYGIYDMSGGAWDFTTNNYDGYSGYNVTTNSYFNGPTGYDSGTFSSGINFPASQYYYQYTTADVNTACGGTICYGQALSETTGWYGDGGGEPYSWYPWTVRGGSAPDGYYSGIFSYSDHSGVNQSNVGFRVTLIVADNI